jgi:hypothetical protein
MYTTLSLRMITRGTELDYAPHSAPLEQSDHGISFKDKGSLAPESTLLELVGHDTTPPPDAIPLPKQDLVRWETQP